MGRTPRSAADALVGLLFGLFGRVSRSRFAQSPAQQVGLTSPHAEPEAQATAERCMLERNRIAERKARLTFI